MRMRVRVCRFAVRGPAGVTNAERAVQRVTRQAAFQLLDAATLFMISRPLPFRTAMPLES